MEKSDRTTYEEKLRLAARRMLTMKNQGFQEKFPVSLIDVDCWEWPQGVGMYGLCKYTMETGDSNIREYLINWYEKRLEEGIVERNVNTTAPMLALTWLYQWTGKESYLEQIRDWAEWMMNHRGLLRTGDGCFQHMITGDPNPGQILIDTLFMAVLFLGRAGRILGRPDWIDEADYQMLVHVTYLLNRQEGLFCHGYSFIRNDDYGGVLWARGNSWYTMGLPEYLEIASPAPGLRRHLTQVYRNQIRALGRYADPKTGLWHTIINDPDSYLELSASAGFLCGILHGLRTGLLEGPEYEDMAARGLEGLLAYIQEDGTVSSVSYGTPVGEDPDHYRKIRRCPMTYGQAMAIMALQEAMMYAAER